MPPRPRHLDRIPNHLVQVDRLRGLVRLNAGECSDLADDLRAILRRLFDHLEPLPELRVVDMSLEQVYSSEDHHQEVVEIMRHPRGHFPEGAELLRPDELLLGGPKLAIGLAELLEEPCVLKGNPRSIGERLRQTDIALGERSCRVIARKRGENRTRRARRSHRHEHRGPHTELFEMGTRGVSNREVRRGSEREGGY